MADFNREFVDSREAFTENEERAWEAQFDLDYDDGVDLSGEDLSDYDLDVDLGDEYGFFDDDFDRDYFSEAEYGGES